MSYEHDVARKREKSEVVATAKRGEPYRAGVREVVPPETWRAIVEAAYQEASRGDDRARDWLLRVLGVADAARVDATIRVMSQRVSHVQLLTEVAEARAAKARAEGRIAPKAECTAPKARAIPPFAAPTDAEPEITYWSVVFDVVTPERWRVVVDTAQRQALHGDLRAREWLTRVLG
ncbi:MAG TPA: hypothetical protein VND64_16390, partial [Pirellulales bacterium]|nr:hypothetical protein [Pirellulales bacterium]